VINDPNISASDKYEKLYHTDGSYENIYLDWIGPSGNLEVIEPDSVLTVNLQPGIYKMKTYLIHDGEEYDPADTIFEIKDVEKVTASISPANNWNGYQVATGATSGRINTSISGGTPPYKYSFDPNTSKTTWPTYSGGQITAGYTVGETTKTIYFTDVNNCEPEQSATCDFKRAPGMVIPEIPEDVETECPLGNAELSFTVSGGVGRYNISIWQSGVGLFYSEDETTSTNFTIYDLPVGIYDLDIFDISQSSSSLIEFSVVDRPALTIDSITYSEIKCFGDKTTATMHSNSRGSVVYYCWSTPAGESYTNNSGVFEGLTPGKTYEFSYDESSCFGPIETTTIPVSSITPITIDSTLTDASCIGSGDGKAVISVSGGTPLSGTEYEIELLSPPRSDRANSKVYTNLGANTLYTVRVTDQNGCQQNGTFKIDAIANPVSIQSAISTDANCNGNSSGSIEVTIAPGDRPSNSYSYVLTDSEYNETSYSGSELSYTFPALEPGTYEIEIFDTAGCSNAQSVPVQVDPNAIQFTPGTETVTNTWCSGISTGSLSATASGGFPGGTNFTYILDQTDGSYYKDSTTNGGIVFEDLPKGIYNLIASDGVGCKDTLTSLQVKVQGQPIAINNLVVQDQYCSELPGSIDISSNSSSGTVDSLVLTYPVGLTELLAQSGSANKTGLPADDNAYSLTITDNLGCKKDTVFYISDLQNDPQISFSVLDSVACNDATNGRLEVSATQNLPTGNFDFTLGATTLTGGSTVTFENLPASSGHTVHVEDPMGCASDTTIVIPVIMYPVAISAFNTIEASCIRATNAGAQLEASGSLADPGYFFVLNSSDTLYGASVEFTNYAVGGSNRIRLYDKFGCKDSTGVFAFLPRTDSLDIAVDLVSNASCPDINDGAIQARAINGTPFPTGYSYRVVDQASQSEVLNTYGAPLATLSSIPAGVYSVEITDQDNCLALAEDIQISEPSAPTLLATPGYVAKKGDATGWINALVQEGNGKYFIEWYNTSVIQPENLIKSDTTTSGAALSGIPAGTYLVRIQDTAKCVFWDDQWLEMTLEVAEPEDSLKLQLSQAKPVSCNGLSDGEFILQASGGWGNEYTFGTTPGDITSLSPVFNGLPAANSYTFYTRDTAGVVASATFEMTQPEVLSASVSEINDVNCFGASDGQAALDIQGGNSTYFVSANQTDWVQGSSITSLAAGTYTLFVRDNLDCQASAEVTINQPTPMTVVDSSVVNTECQSNEGSISATVEGGSPGYSYAWYEGTTFLGGGSPSIENLYSGAYTLEVTDNNGCLQEFNFYVTDLTNLEITSLETTPVSCWGGDDGSANVEVGNGYPPYEITWHDGSNQNNIPGLTAGTYLLSVYDSKGCKVFENFTINSPDSLDVQILELTEPLCLGVADGRIEVSATGGTPDYSYAWNTGRNRDNITNIDAGSLQVLVTDANNCTKTFDFSIGYSEKITTGLPGELVLCRDNSYPLDAGNFEYFSWYQDDDYISAEAVLEVSEAGEYVVEVEDSRGCQVADTIEIGTSETELGAQFLMASVVHQNDTLVVFEASDPVPDSISLFINESIVTIDSGQYYRHLVATDTGSFKVTLVSFLSDCQDIITKTLTVLPAGEEGDNIKAAVLRTIKSARLFPNPTDGIFALELELYKESDVTLRMVSYGDGSTLLIRNLKGGDYYHEPFNFEGLMPGTYLLSIQAGDEMQTLKVVVY
jgi:plastocyanin